MDTQVITKVDKAQLKNLSFNNKIDFPRIDSEMLEYKLNRALILGNLHKISVQIQFCSSSNEYMETMATIWAVTEKYVMLKGGVMIPKDSIIDIII